MSREKQISYASKFRLTNSQRSARAFLESLFEEDLISPDARQAVLNKIMPRREWGYWTSQLLILLGSTLFLAGVVFFFAYNWVYIQPLWKLTIVEAGIILGLFGALYFSIFDLKGKISALSAGLLVGVFLAVFGQIYQTGANAYSLFGAWMLLILPWVIIARFSAFWVLWFVVSQLALVTYWNQGLLSGINFNLLIFTLCSLSGCTFLIFHEWAFNKEGSQADPRWVRIISVFYSLGAVLPPLIYFIFDQSLRNIGAAVGSLIALAIISGAYYIFRYKLIDKIALTATVGAISIALGSLATKVIFFDSINFKYSGLFLLLAFVYLGITVGAIIHLRRVFKIIGNSHD